LAPSGECLRGNGPPDRIAICFWQPIPSELNLIVVAVLRDSLCVVSCCTAWQTVVCCIPCVRLSGLSY